MASLKFRGLTIDTVAMKQELQDLRENTLDEAADLAYASLNEMIIAINENSTYRREQVNPYISPKLRMTGTQDAPLSGAKVIVRRRGSKVIATVKHSAFRTGVNLFNILDAGSPDKTPKKKVFFPVYIGNLIPVNEPMMGDPKKVRTVLRIPIIVTDDKGIPIIAVIKKGQTISGFQGKKLYLQTARYVSDQLTSQRIVNPKRRSFLRLKRSDIVIKVSKR